MLKKLLITLVILSMILAFWFIHLLWSAGQFKTIKPHYSGTCSRVKNVIGAEDITIHPKSGIAFVSSCDRRSVNAGGPGKGGIYAYDLSAASPEPILITPDMGEDFRPHGISLYEGKNGKDTLFVVNHEGGNHRIDLFEFKNGRLVLKQSLKNKAIISPNDLVAAGPDRFYFTNDHRYVTGIMRVVEDYLRLKLGNVIYYDGNNFVTVASGIGYANGININMEKNELYVCSPTGGSLHVFHINRDNGMLMPKETIDLNTGVDNVEVDNAGDLWIGAHPKLLDFAGHAMDRSKLSPSQVLHLSRKKSGGFTVDEVYLNDGHPLSGSSVAAFRNNRLLIGGVFDDGFLDCRH